MKIQATIMFAVLAAIGPAATLSWKPYTYTTGDRPAVKIEGEITRVDAPENHAAPDGRKVQLALMRLRSSGAPATAPILYLHGGPGNAGIQLLGAREFRDLFEAMRAAGDVLLLDQRGCGLSAPSLLPKEPLQLTGAALATRESFLAVLEKHSRAERDRLLREGVDPAQYTIPASVHDIEAVRVALGVPRLRLVGHSYGTQLAQAYLRQFPDRVERAVLIGPEGLDMTWKMPAESDAQLRRIAVWAAASPAAAPAMPDMLGTLRRVLEKLDAQPVRFTYRPEQGGPMQFEVGGFALRFIIAKFYLGDPVNSRFLPKLLDELDKGRTPMSLVYNLGQMSGSGLSYTWITTDAATGVAAPRRAEIQRQESQSVLGVALNFPITELNAVWQVPDLGEEFRRPVTSDVPVLFVAGTEDGLTPPEQARSILTGFPRGAVLVVEGGGHVSQLAAPGLARAVADYLAGGTPPGKIAMPLPEFAPLITPRK